MTDRELHELAAKAAGLIGEWKVQASPSRNVSKDIEGFFIRNPKGGYGKLWNPLTDDGDALRLAVKLNLLVGVAKCWSGQDQLRSAMFGEDPLDPAATRRAILRAAAEVGRAMP